MSVQLQFCIWTCAYE